MRVRLLKPETFKDEHLADVSMAARFLFMGLWTLADREGRLEDRPKWIRAELLPYDTGVDVDALLNELASPKAFILRYEVEGRNFIQLTNFLKHQKPHPREAPSCLPAPRQAKDNPRRAKVSQGAASRSVSNSNSDSNSDRDPGRDVETPVTSVAASEPTGTPDGTPLINPWDFDEPTATVSESTDGEQTEERAAKTAGNPRRLTPQALGIRTDPGNMAQVQLSHDITALVSLICRSSRPDALGDPPLDPKTEALEALHAISATPKGKRVETLDWRSSSVWGGLSTEWATVSSHAAYKLAAEVYGADLANVQPLELTQETPLANAGNPILPALKSQAA